MTPVIISWMLIALAVSFFATRLLVLIVPKWGVVDRPDGERRTHAKAVPLLGGIAVFVAVTVCVDILLLSGDQLTGGLITTRHYVGFLIGGLILMVGGYLDDKHRLSPRLAVVAPIIAALIAIASGIQVEKLTNPFGGVIELAPWQSHVLVFAWLMGAMYTTKFLDGLDGLATSVSSVGAFMVMSLALTVAYFQPDVALFAAIGIGALAGFLFWNVPPAAIFLGEGGSTFVGYLIGTLAVISGGKIATAALVLGIPIMDVAWVILRRWKSGGVKNVFKGDRKHLHHRLLALGWTSGQVVAGYTLVAAAFGSAALFLQSREKLLAMLALFGLMLFLAAFLVARERTSHD
ncbi:undecaprenyl/decaprenyl-phosphate alpha-N-acetylglucosaminyl 1-phosphate transferase [Patescibacteria group bacterium]|nr:MAG: undecaprenyl/decaprenyl-phosphate alpha-N-acetylglucosaminyl 1-phosphate transferase [Patescibacteria group bacterium]